MNDPLICEVTRGTMVESRHRIHAMMMDSTGVLASWGNPDLMLYPRSSIKYLQALPLVECGAADHFGVNDAEVALAAASHSGEPDHVAAVSAWLGRLGLDAEALTCGAHLPYNADAAHAMLRAGEQPTRLNNNCSGKHTGFLATAQHLGEPTAGYADIDHPVQRRLFDILQDLGGEALDGTGRGVDGCGIPVYGMTLRALTRAVQRVADPQGLGEARGAAAQRIYNAVTAYPFMVGGSGRFDTDVMVRLKGAAATKGGAEGVHIAIVSGRKIGIALKSEDGEKRAADVAMGWLLAELGMFDGVTARALQSHLQPAILNAAGDHVGTIRIAANR